VIAKTAAISELSITHHPVHPIHSYSFGRSLIGHATPTEDQAVYDVRLGEARAARSRAISQFADQTELKKMNRMNRINTTR
jgi:hypothetical protein